MGASSRVALATSIRDGILIDTAREAGIRYPVALTRAAWERCVAVPAGVVCQDEPGRLWDVAWMPRGAARGGGPVRRSRPEQADAAASLAQGGLRTGRRRVGLVSDHGSRVTSVQGTSNPERAGVGASP